jgi:NAD dependent epimerase/dehydratase family enzyme
MITPFKLGLGGIIGSGKQHFSYIHIEDLIEVYKFVIENSLMEYLIVQRQLLQQTMSLQRH